MKNGARRDQAAISPPIAGPLIPPIRKPPEYRPLARPRCSLGTLPSSRVCALTLNIAEPSPPTPRSTMSCVKESENPARMLLTATIPMPADITLYSPKRFTSRPDGSAPATRSRANALITLAALAVLTPK
jgi:hypothetical protein